MNSYKILPAGDSAALDYTVEILQQKGYSIALAPDPEVKYLLLPVPSFEASGCIKGGIPLRSLLEQLPEDVCILGGNLQGIPKGYHCVDLLQDPFYVSQNAAITAHCAISLAMQKLPVTLEKLPVAVIGWGRIGKCLAKLLQGLGADVTVCARKESDRAMLTALGYKSAPLPCPDPLDTELVFNTAPADIDISLPDKCLQIDLASKKGLPGQDVIWARGLPGKDAPKSSGQLIAQTILPILTKRSDPS